MIASDHSPHTPEEKARPLTRAPSGMVGLETLLAASLTRLYHTGKVELPAIIRKMTANPADILHVNKGRMSVGTDADLVDLRPGSGVGGRVPPSSHPRAGAPPSPARP